ncbi:exonuclease domain-containing protein [Anaerolineales bacterium HSG25]|nr:exonuclease domain-containing protein [Anaerolineales bacterium HSG25]
MKKDEVYISVDIEASGPVPGEYSMLSMGACVVYDTAQTFYAELKPLNQKFVPAALEVAGLSLSELAETGLEPQVGMTQFEGWVKTVANGDKPVFVAFNATFDWMFTTYYFHRFLGRNPFGISGLDVKAYYMGKLDTSWGQTTKRNIKPRFMSKRQHTHNALDDALEQAELFRNLLEHEKGVA